jgi:hypothetical protein
VFSIGGVEFHNKTLFHNLSDTDECFLYILTLGETFSTKLEDSSDYLVAYYLDKIGNFFLRRLRKKLVKHIAREHGAENLSQMSPGSTTVWPITEGEKVFEVLGDEVNEIGVRLSERHLMIPFKTVSGILFHKEKQFFDCLLCQQTDCQSRHAAYDPQVADFYHNL